MPNHQIDERIRIFRNDLTQEAPFLHPFLHTTLLIAFRLPE